MVGNLSEGYTAVGPFENFEMACLYFDNEPDSWIMTLELPSEEFLPKQMREDNETI